VLLKLFIFYLLLEYWREVCLTYSCRKHGEDVKESHRHLESEVDIWFEFILNLKISLSQDALGLYQSLLNIILCFLGFWHRVISQIDANASEKHAVSIFRAEVTRLRSRDFYRICWTKAEEREPIPSFWLAPFSQTSFLRSYRSPLLLSLVTSALKMEEACFSEALASICEITQCQNPRKHQYYTNLLYNLKSNLFNMY
jgi:hypothetical protein